jgi:hypothetical protein
MSELTIITNNVPRNLTDDYELSPEERKEFDYLNWDKIEAGEDSATFFRYKGQLYDLGEFETTRLMPEFSPIRKWHGYHSDSFFSGIVVRYANEDQIVVGRFYS